MALTVGQRAPDFVLKSHDGRTIRLSDYRGLRNVVLVFFPLAWTPIWTSQIPSYQAVLDRFDGVKAQVLGLSVDSDACLKAWADSLGGISYPLLSDFYPHGQVAQTYGVLRREGFSERAIYIVDRQGAIRYVDVHAIDDQPNNDVIFAELEKLQPKTAATSAERPAEPPPSPEPDADVVLYCTPWCLDCNKARRYLKGRNVAFVEVDISRDRGAAARVRGWANGNETTPTFKIYGQVIVGFSEARLSAALATGQPEP